MPTETHTNIPARKLERPQPGCQPSARLEAENDGRTERPATSRPAHMFGGTITLTAKTPRNADRFLSVGVRRAVPSTRCRTENAHQTFASRTRHPGRFEGGKYVPSDHVRNRCLASNALGADGAGRNRPGAIRRRQLRI